MADAPISYRMIRGSSSGIIEYTSLYTSPDHLLQINSSGYSESYRRFYFRDIQSITVRKSGAGKIINGILGVLAAACLVSTTQGGPFIMGWGIPAFCFLVLLAVNILRGPTCSCEIRTAVQTRRLSSLKRLRQAAKFLEQLRPEIDAAQGTLPPGEIVRRLEQLRQSGFFTPTETPSGAPANAPDAAGGVG